MAIAANVPDAAVDPANAIYVNQGDDEAVQLESLCMNCHENVRNNPEATALDRCTHRKVRNLSSLVCRVQQLCC